MGLTLGLDVSTTCTGYALIDDELNLIDCGYVNLDFVKNKQQKDILFLKLDKLMEKIKEISESKLITNIVVEDIIKKFSYGKSSAHTLILLAKFNGMVTYALTSLLHLIPENLNATTARKTAQCSVAKGEDIKKHVLEKVKEWYPQIEIKINKLGNIDKKNYDMADATLLTRAFILQGKYCLIAKERLKNV